LITLGVITDTHVPDRAERLAPQALDVFRQAKVDAILHAGDVCVQGALDDLAKIAPVHAVFGNRDVYRLPELPIHQTLTFNGVKVGLAHGHENWKNYVTDKFVIAFTGLRPEPYIRRLLPVFPDADVIVFGHLHIPVQKWVNGKLFFNPGSACCPYRWGKYPPAVGLLYIEGKGKISAEIVPFSPKAEIMPTPEAS